jgi:predicted transcriptional regulator
MTYTYPISTPERIKKEANSLRVWQRKMEQALQSIDEIA